MNENYNILLSKLDSFIKKYYLNQVIRGLLISTSAFITFFLITSLSEYFGHFSQPVRKIMFFTVCIFSSFTFIKLIFLPLLKYYKIGKTISHKQAATIVSKHFSNIQDKLLNTLELAEKSETDNTSFDLVIASINQKTTEIKPVHFNNAINLKKNYKYIKFALTLILIISVIVFFWPGVLTEGSARVLQYDTHFQKEAPFKIFLLNDTLNVQKGSDYTARIEVKGKYVPENISIVFGSSNFLMTRNSKSRFSYTFKNLNNSLSFFCSAEGFNSSKYNINVLPTPAIIDFLLSVEVPAYTKDSNKVLSNIGDITVPCGSKLKWTFNTKDIDSLAILFNDSIKADGEKDNNSFSVSKTLITSASYKVAIKNKHFGNNEFVKYNINVVPDLAPSIKINTIKDSIKFSSFYYNGVANDDYGFSRLSFCFTTYNADNKTDTTGTIALPLNKNINSQEFYYAFDFSSINIESGQKAEYYFEVCDNDAIFGSKCAKSSVQEFVMPTKDELQNIEDETAKNLEAKLSESMKIAKDIKKDINNLQESLINKNLTSWDKTKIMEQLNSKQNRLEELMQQVSKEFQQKNDMLNSMSEQEKEILEKQKQMQELLNNIMTDELKKMMEELNKLMQEFDKKKINEITKDMKYNYEDLSKQLDRNMELLKKYELEKKIDNTIERLEKLSEEQEKLSQETEKENAEKDKENLSEKQEKQMEELDKLSKEYEEIKEKNNELKNPMKLDDKKEETNSIKKEMKDGKENMKENKMKKASKNQKESSKKMKEMAESMKKMMQQQQSEQQEEDLDALRKVLENLVTFSFSQENLMEELKDMQAKNPKYVTVVSNQKNLSESFTVIKDSLTALALRTPQIKSMVTKELKQIDRNTEKTLEGLGERNVGMARTSQQFVMTSANNLALMLAEAMKQMESQQEGPSDSQCKKSGKSKKGKKPDLKGMREQQESLKSQMEKMMDQLKKGQKDGNGAMDPNSKHKKLSQMLAQQEIFQQMMNEIMSNNSLNPQTQKALNEIKNLMDKNQTDLINKNINPETIKRQNLIVTRLLEAEKAEYQREIDNKRESKEAKNENFSNPEQFFKYKSVNLKFNELLNTSNLKLYKYYKNKYKEYLIKLNEN